MLKILRFINKIGYKDNFYRLLSTSIDNFLVYKMLRKPKRGPLYVTWDIVKNCNVKCLYCDYWKSKNFGLALEDKLRIIKEMGRYGIWMLSFCGGDPLLDKDLPLLIKSAKANGMLVNVSTNGLLLKEMHSSLIESNLDSIIISVESHKDEVHDAIRNHPGLLRKIKEGIEILKRKRKDNKPYISIRMLINRQNYKMMREYVNYWRDKVDNILFKPLTENKKIFYTIPEHMKLLNEDKEIFENIYSSLFRENPDLDNIYHREIPNYIFDHKSLHDKYRCFAGIFFADIDIEGHLYICGEHRVMLGDLKKQSFSQIWSSDFSQDIRRRLKIYKIKCFCCADLFLINIYLTKVVGGPN